MPPQPHGTHRLLFKHAGRYPASRLTLTAAPSPTALSDRLPALPSRYRMSRLGAGSRAHAARAREVGKRQAVGKRGRDNGISTTLRVASTRSFRITRFRGFSGGGRAGSGVGVTVDSRSAGTYGDRNRLRAGAGGKRLWFRRGRRACGGCCRVSRRVPGRACAARSCRCDAATPRGRCSMATSIHVEPAGMRLLRVVDAGEVDGTLHLSREGCGDTLVDRAASPRCGLSVPS